MAVCAEPTVVTHRMLVGPVNVKSPSSRTGLLPSIPLRTVHERFPSHSSSPSNASFGETRFRDRNALAVIPFMGICVKWTAVLGALRTNHHNADALGNGQTRDATGFSLTA